MDGKRIAEEKLRELGREIKEGKLSPSLAVVWVGDNQVSNIYVKIKKEKLEKIGIKVSVYSFPESISEEDLCEKILSLKEDGVIVQLPLPRNINKKRILNAVPKEKDVDFLSFYMTGVFYNGEERFLPPVVGAVKTLFDYYDIDYKEKKVALVGAGALVGKPLSVFFMNHKNTVSVLNSKTKDIGFFTKDADIVVSGTGVVGLIKKEMIKQGAVVIDAGTATEKGILKGDVDIESVKEKASFVSPVPGGVGPLTVYHLAKNHFYTPGV
jgi:methylenetetrahydrofolate dehydrogenase (NADP+) / methenyltetrahydrofolate cyclohydrolase